jgi:cell division transport system permease protein
LSQHIDFSTIPRFLLFRPDIPFARDDAGRYIPWIVALMVCLAGLLLCGGVTLGSSVGRLSNSYSDSFTVQVPYQTDNSHDSQAAVIAYLKRQHGVHDVELVDEETLRKRLAPWLGKAEILDDLPLPVVIEVETDNPPPDLVKIGTELKALVPGTEVDAHEIWMTKFSRFAETLRIFVYSFAAFILFSLAMMMIFVSKAALRLHGKTVMLLHSIGADDRYIARQFQFNAGLLALRGALPGSMLAMVILWVFEIYTSKLQAPLLSDFSFGLQHAGMLLLLPFLCTVIAVVSARIAVLRQLRAVL